MKISILTATYNRKELLKNVYKSLLENKKEFSNFEWLIMDDGSTDGTKELVEKWIHDRKVPLLYFKQPNQGKMKAINGLMKHVSGNVVLELDSDDFLLKHALKTLASDYEHLDKEACGIIYHREITEPIDKEFNRTYQSLWHLHNVLGYDSDMTLTFRTSIRKKYDYELEKDEKFVTEARTYYKLEQETKGFFLALDEMLVGGTYLEDGYTKNIETVFKKYPYGYFAYFKECLNYSMKGVPFKRRLYFLKHYILFSYLTKKKWKEVRKEVRGIQRFLLFFLYIPGRIVSKRRFGEVK